ncbi:hypothetical protein, partial [Brachybacterium alimentarium]|uniref:hypothetical protein n=1 Tax=Brachybacterium alimentarium TaxID=47845 RepID=UPI003FD0B37A
SAMSLLRSSRCQDASWAPQILHWAVIEGDRRIVVREFTDAIRSAVDPRHFVDAMADIRATLETIERCCATVPGEVEPVARDQNLFELKISFKTWGLLVRIYETEDPRLPGYLVALRAHQKVVNVSQQDIDQMQNLEIDIASRRWVSGHATLWGIAG